MTPISLVMAYYDNPTMLQHHYDSILSMPNKVREHISLVIVDDCSPNYPARPADLRGVPLQVYRMRKDVRWNQDACRNIGVRHAETNWVVLTDIDHMIPSGTWMAMQKANLHADTVYTFARVSAPDMGAYKPHPNTWLMDRAMYDRIGGYDERFAGLYGTDSDFRNRVVTNAKTQMFKEPIIRIPRTHIPDASTTSYLRKQPEDSEGIRRVKEARSQLDDQSPLRYTFEYDRVYPEVP